MLFLSLFSFPVVLLVKALILLPIIWGCITLVHLVIFPLLDHRCAAAVRKDNIHWMVKRVPVVLRGDMRLFTGVPLAFCAIQTRIRMEGGVISILVGRDHIISLGLLAATAVLQAHSVWEEVEIVEDVWLVQRTILCHIKDTPIVMDAHTRTMLLAQRIVINLVTCSVGMKN